MQTTEMGQMLQILNSPLGASLIPQLQQRENMVMDQSQADLASTVARTGVVQDENRRANEMQPYKLDQLKVGNEQTGLENETKRFDQGVKNLNGQEFYAKKDRDAESGKRIREAAESSRNLGMAASAVRELDGIPLGAPGERRAQVKKILTDNGLETLHPLVDHIQDETKIGAALMNVAKGAAEVSRQYMQEGLKVQGANERAGINAMSAERVALIRERASRYAADLRARASVGKDGKQKDPLLEQLAGIEIRKALAAETDEQRMFHEEAANKIMEFKRRGTASSTAVTNTIAPDGQGGVKFTPAPRNPSPEAPVTLPPKPGLPATQNPTAPTKANAEKLPVYTKEKPAQIKAQADYDKLRKGDVYVHPQTGKLMQKN